MSEEQVYLKDEEHKTEKSSFNKETISRHLFFLGFLSPWIWIYNYIYFRDERFTRYGTIALMFIFIVMIFNIASSIYHLDTIIAIVDCFMCNSPSPYVSRYCGTVKLFE